MRTLLPLVALFVVGCSSSSTSVLGPAEDEPVAACRGNSGNCDAGGQQNNNPNNPPATAP